MKNCTLNFPNTPKEVQLQVHVAVKGGLWHIPEVSALKKVLPPKGNDDNREGMKKKA